jgi:hypothetical protein
VSGLMKLVAQMAHCPPAIEEIVGKYKRSRHIDLQQVFNFLPSRTVPTTFADTLMWDIYFSLAVLRVRGPHRHSRHDAHCAAP